MSGDGFLSRWSRRKRQEAREEQREESGRETHGVTEEVAPAQADVPAVAGDSESALTEEELAALPPIDTIDEATDISGYLRKGVPAALKNAALRRVWAATPAVRDYLDPAREYAYDWNVPGGVPGDAPLSADFDAKALADRLFTKRETKAVEVHTLSESGQEGSGDLSHVDEKNSDSPGAETDGAQNSAQLARENPMPERPQSATAQEFIAAAAAPTAGFSRPEKPQNTLEPRDFRPQPRRHGGATPV